MFTMTLADRHLSEAEPAKVPTNSFEIETVQDKNKELASSMPRVLHVLDHSWPVHSGYSFRSYHMITAQRRLGFSPAVVTGPLHLADDREATDSIDDTIRYWRTIYGGPLSRWLIEDRIPFLREMTVVKLLKRKISQILENERFDLVPAHSPALCGL